ncbi:plasma membrane proteolipid 3 [Histoplasma capsulatum var. duboisii H88]|uniref:Plasma membrane proteolipid 3 n=1 Tax=Ajellomyces capsulatus (strain H88) TaxID=544711 RepID=A0A8A1LDV8_AJEC8|nr:plasma membrane proteolipid 3 [Histoplasma capsulatum var. duboisii H88]
MTTVFVTKRSFSQFFAIFRRSTWKKKKFLVLFVIAGAQGLFGYPAAFFLRCLSRFPLNSGLCLLPSPCFPLFFRHASQVPFFPPTTQRNTAGEG